jgi:hypothetical protein
MGRMLSLPEDVVYLHEPFNLDVGSHCIPFQFHHWFRHIPDLPDPESFFRAMNEALEFRHIAPQSDPPSWQRTWKPRLRNLKRRLCGHLPLIKDPIALFSAGELADRFNLDVVCMIRHPLAFCSSLKKWGWEFPFTDLLAQPRLMERYFAEDASTIAEFATAKRPVVHQAALLWNLFHKVIRYYEQTRPDWKFRRHEDMVADPVGLFEALYQELALEFTPEVAEKLRQSLSSHTGETVDINYKARDGSTVTQTWKSRLTGEEIDHVLFHTRDLRKHFYPDGTGAGRE